MKDSKGHGSNGKGGADYDARGYNPVMQGGKRMFGRQPTRAEAAANSASVKAFSAFAASHNDKAAAGTLAAPGHPKVAPPMVHPGASGRHDYNPDSVNAAIASNNRHGPKIGGREAKLIHRLMKGR